MKVPPHQWEATAAFYRDVLGLAPLEPFTGTPPSIGFTLGANRLWIDKVVGMSQTELWLEIVTDDATAAAEHLAQAGVPRCDDIEPLPDGVSSFWISGPSQVIHLVGPGD